MQDNAAAVNPDYQRAAVMAWGYFNERGLYMQTAFRDAIERHGRVFADKKGAAMVALLRRVVDGEDLPTPAASPAESTPKGDEGLKALAVVMGAALRSVPGAWDEWARTSGN
jgi:hypothetical protein